MDPITPNSPKNTQIIEAMKVFDVKDPKKASIQAYDYYEPGEKI